MSDLTSVCVFCGSSSGTRAAYEKAAHALGTALADNGIELVFGAGGSGIMGAVSRACLESGGRVTGIIPEHLTRIEAPLAGLTECIVVPDMHTRKRLMFERSDAIVVLPGGFGTMDETFEILTWRQLGLHDKPVILVDIEGYWRPFLAFSESMIREGFVRPSNRELFRVVDGVDSILPVARAEAEASSQKPKTDLF